LTAKKILFGVFDWGLGHAMRNMPLIQALLENGHHLEIISTGRALTVLKRRFGDVCQYHDVPSVFCPYTESRHLTLNVLFSLPAILFSLHQARRISERIIRKGRYDVVISDCRLDVYDQVENSFLINHQLRIKTFFGAQQVIEAWLCRMMSRYGKVIVPDFPHSENMSGVLSHDLLFFDSDRVAYIGILSNLKKRDCKKDIDCFISISRPEPQRTVLERKILAHARFLPGTIVIAGGNPDITEVKTFSGVTYYGYLSPARQEEMMNRASFFISRSGYTTLMELAEMDMKAALLIPMPGQTEQEYLADYYESRGWFHHTHQDRLSLQTDIEACQGFKGFSPPWRTEESVRKFMDVVGCRR